MLLPHLSAIASRYRLDLDVLLFDILLEWSREHPAPGDQDAIAYRAEQLYVRRMTREYEERRADACRVVDGMQNPGEPYYMPGGR